VDHCCRDDLGPATPEITEVPAQSRLIATFLATFVCLSPSAASELPTTMPPFTGEVITLHEGANTFDLTSQGPRGLVIAATYLEYFRTITCSS
jgi:hypothetical protein